MFVGLSPIYTKPAILIEVRVCLGKLIQALVRTEPEVIASGFASLGSFAGGQTRRALTVAIVLNAVGRVERTP
jgi:hypothetical protein